jgi:anaerobic magnesium-protoporphyrin IX monomethyl ester cyclase
MPPLGLLAIGGPLIDDGHEVHLIDGDLHNWSTPTLIHKAVQFQPEAVLFGHSGSTSGHPVIAEVARGIAATVPGAHIIYGGVFPTYHWREILEHEPYVTAIVRGEGEETVCRLLRALEHGNGLETVRGIAFRGASGLCATPPAPFIRDLDACRIGWELIDHADYSYWGGLRAVVVQFSRGCPHQCIYCGQRGFWTSWRHRNPLLFAKEIAHLHREHGIKVFFFADENPTSSKKAWRAFLEALIAEKVDVILGGTARADDIVRDADILHLYKKAGWTGFLLGIENTGEETLRTIRKGTTTAKDREAIRLLRQHSIISVATWTVGFEEETDRDHWRGLRQLLSYDPDQIHMLYATPHRWTPFFRQAAHRPIIQTDQRLWDYKHQVLATRHMPAWRVFLWVKFTEVVMQGRPKALWRVLFMREPVLRNAMRWYMRIGLRVWFHEVWRFLQGQRVKDGPRVADFWGAPQDAEEQAMAMPRSSVPKRALSGTPLTQKQPNCSFEAQRSVVFHQSRTQTDVFKTGPRS